MQTKFSARRQGYPANSWQGPASIGFPRASGDGPIPLFQAMPSTASLRPPSTARGPPHHDPLSKEGLMMPQGPTRIAALPTAGPPGADHSETYPRPSSPPRRPPPTQDPDPLRTSPRQRTPHSANLPGQGRCTCPTTSRPRICWTGESSSPPTRSSWTQVDRLRGRHGHEDPRSFQFRAVQSQRSWQADRLLQRAVAVA